MTDNTNIVIDFDIGVEPTRDVMDWEEEARDLLDADKDDTVEIHDVKQDLSEGFDDGATFIRGTWERDDD